MFGRCARRMAYDTASPRRSQAPIRRGANGLAHPASRSAWLRASLRSVMHAMESVFKLFLEIGKRARQRRRPCDKNIVVSGLRARGGNQVYGGLQPAANPVADDRVADLLGDREAEARRQRCGGGRRSCRRRTRVNGGIGGRPGLRLQHERCRRPARTTSNAQELGAFLEGNGHTGRPSHTVLTRLRVTAGTSAEWSERKTRSARQGCRSAPGGAYRQPRSRRCQRPDRCNPHRPNFGNRTAGRCTRPTDACGPWRGGGRVL